MSRVGTLNKGRNFGSNGQPASRRRCLAWPAVCHKVGTRREVKDAMSLPGGSQVLRLEGRG